MMTQIPNPYFITRAREEDYNYCVTLRHCVITLAEVGGPAGQ
jgi:hypothetical protein